MENRAFAGNCSVSIAPRQASPVRAEQNTAFASQSATMYATSGAVRWLLIGVTYQPACVAAM